MNKPRRLRIAVIGHVEHVTVGLVPAVPGPGDIAHLEEPLCLPGGGGGIAFFQLATAPAEVHLFTALGNDDAARAVEERLRATRAQVHAARRDEPHTRDIVMVAPDGSRTIVVVGEPLHPRRDDALPWDVLQTCDAVYFTAQDPELLRAARAAGLLALTARRASALAESGVRADVVIGSADDPREAGTLADYAVPPAALVMTRGALGGRIETADGVSEFAAPPPPHRIVADYGAGDSFAGALVWYLASGLSLAEACTRAGAHGAAVLRGLDPTALQRPLT
ncbi:MAG: PfkB family carbohydrate kinase [Dehalococcoidia bacterium]